MQAKKFYYKGDQVTYGELVKLTNIPERLLLRNVLPENVQNECELLISTKIVIHGTTYKNDTPILLRNDDEMFPKFGLVKTIYTYNNLKILIITEYDTIKFNPKLNSYLIQKPLSSSIVAKRVQDLIFSHPLSIFMISRELYVPLINHEQVEFA